MKKMFQTVLTCLALATAIPLAAAPSGSWANSIAQLIAQEQSYPRSAQLRGEEGTTRLRVTITASGNVESVEIIQGSGSAILDREARKTITTIGRFPTPPDGRAVITIPIVWRLR